jgi:hypothetical protein
MALVQAEVVYRGNRGQYIVTQNCFKVTGKQILEKMAEIRSEYNKTFKLSKEQHERLEIWKETDEKRARPTPATLPPPPPLKRTAYELLFYTAKDEGAATHLIRHHEEGNGTLRVWVDDAAYQTSAAVILEHEINKAARRLTPPVKVEYDYGPVPMKAVALRPSTVVFVTKEEWPSFAARQEKFLTQGSGFIVLQNVEAVTEDGTCITPRPKQKDIIKMYSEGMQMTWPDYIEIKPFR